MANKLFVFTDPADGVQGAISMDNGMAFTSQPDTHPTGRAGYSFTFPEGTPDGNGARLKLAVGSKGFSGKGTLMLEELSYIKMDDFTLVETGQIIQPPTNGTGVVGCMNGRLEDPVAWFFNRIKRQIGMPADDWHSVLSNSGIAAGGGPGEIIAIPDPEGTYGIRLQIGSEGPRGRWYAPSTKADDLGYFTCEYQCIADDPARLGHFVWAHIVFKAGTYFAHPCPAAGVATASVDTRSVWVPLAGR